MSLRERTRPGLGIITGKVDGETAGAGRGKADCGEDRQAAGAIAPNVMRVGFVARSLGQSDMALTCRDVPMTLSGHWSTPHSTPPSEL